MDYKYIEQLLERYWECQTTLEEEAILRSFFAQEDIPARLLPYRDLFQAEEEMANERLSDDFDEKLMNRIEEGNVDGKGQKANAPSHPSSFTLHPSSLTFAQRLAPFYRAAAIVAVVLTIGMAAQQGFQNSSEETTTTNTLSVIPTEADSIHLFTDMPEPVQQTEAVLSTTQTDSLVVVK